MMVAISTSAAVCLYHEPRPGAGTYFGKGQFSTGQGALPAECSEERSDRLRSEHLQTFTVPGQVIGFREPALWSPPLSR